MLDFCIREIISGFEFHGQVVNEKIHGKKYPQIARVHVLLSEKHSMYPMESICYICSYHV